MNAHVCKYKYVFVLYFKLSYFVKFVDFKLQTLKKFCNVSYYILFVVFIGKLLNILYYYSELLDIVEVVNLLF